MVQDKKRGLEAGHYNHVPNQGRHRIIYAFENDMDYCVSQNEVINILTPHCQWRSQRGAGNAPWQKLCPPLAPQMKLHFVQRSMESRHFESQSAPSPPPAHP